MWTVSTLSPSSFLTYVLPVLFARKRLWILCVPPKFHNLPSCGNINQHICCPQLMLFLFFSFICIKLNPRNFRRSKSMSRVMLLLQIEDKSGAHTILHDDLGLKSTLIESHFSLIRVSSRVSSHLSYRRLARTVVTNLCQGPRLV